MSSCLGPEKSPRDDKHGGWGRGSNVSWLPRKIRGPPSPGGLHMAGSCARACVSACLSVSPVTVVRSLSTMLRYS